jgi:hypothetical protein
MYMTLTATYSTTHQVQDALSFIMRTRYVTASFLIRELLMAEAKRLNYMPQEPQATEEISRHYTHIVKNESATSSLSNN